MTLKRKMSLIVGLLFVALGISILMTYRSAKASHDVAQHMVTDHIVRIKAMQSLNLALMHMDSGAMRFFNTGDLSWLSVVRSEKQNVVYSLEQLRKIVHDPEESDTLYIIQKTFNRYAKNVDTLIKKRQSNSLDKKDLANWSAFDGDLDKIYLRAQQYIAFNEGQLTAAQDQAGVLLSRNRRTAAWAMVVAGGGCLLALFVLMMTVVKPVNVMLGTIKEFDKEKSFKDIPVYRHDELGELARAFNNLGHHLEAERLRLKEQAVRDELTGVYNIRYFRQKIEEEFSRAMRYGYALSMLMIDVDHFKHYNDTHGHPLGDIILRDVAKVIRESVRDTDIVCRYGGEEFSVLLLATQGSTAYKIAEKIRTNVEHYSFPKGDSQPQGAITVSIGVSTFSDGHPSLPQGLINLADKALYQAKVQGRNRVCTTEPSETETAPPMQQKRRPATFKGLFEKKV